MKLRRHLETVSLACRHTPTLAARVRVTSLSWGAIRVAVMAPESVGGAKLREGLRVACILGLALAPVACFYAERAWRRRCG